MPVKDIQIAMTDGTCDAVIAAPPDGTVRVAVLMYPAA